MDTSDSATPSSTNNNNNTLQPTESSTIVSTTSSSPVPPHSPPSSATSQSRQSSADDTSSNDGQQAAASNLDADLPTGWSMQVAPNGRVFFIDHNERKTSWVDPRTGRASSMPNQTRKLEDDLGPLPEGWEERVHSDGRIFFIDHSKF